MPRALVDDTALPALDDGPAPFPIEDAVAGSDNDSDSGKDDPAPATTVEPAPAASQVGTQSEQDEVWGPFSFQIVRRQTDRGLQQSLSVRCPFHRDPTDPSGTTCRKYRAFIDHASFNRQRAVLRQWALAGRHRSSRAHPAHCSHKHLKPESLDVLSLAEQDSLLAEAIADGVEWLITAQGPTAADADDGSSSSSSSESSS